MLGFLDRLFKRKKLPVACYGRTDTGRVRNRNEDTFAVLVEQKLFFVADGMGGHKAGDVASRTAVETLVKYFSADKLRSIAGNEAAIQHSLISAYHLANERVMKLAAHDAELAGMGSTLVGCFIDGAMLHICHVGDSRCYLAKQNGMEAMTTDHTAVATVGGPDGSEGQPAKSRTVVTRAIGFPFPKDPDYRSCRLERGDRVLLCSDGLWSMLDDMALARIVQQAESPEEAAETLVREANSAGGKDNITAVVIFC